MQRQGVLIRMVARITHVLWLELRGGRVPAGWKRGRPLAGRVAAWRPAHHGSLKQHERSSEQAPWSRAVHVVVA